MRKVSQLFLDWAMGETQVKWRLPEKAELVICTLLIGGILGFIGGIFMGVKYFGR